MDNYMTTEELALEWETCIDQEKQREKIDLSKKLNVLKIVKKRVSASWYKSILQFIDDNAFVYDFKITDKAVGERQKEQGLRFTYIYIDQYCNGGHFGDDFAGQICIPIRGGMYLSYHYND